MVADPAEYRRTDLYGARVLVVTGDLSAESAAALRDHLFSLISEAHSPGLVDLSEVTLLDGHAIIELLAARNRAIRWNRTIVLVNPSSVCMQVFESTGLNMLFEIRE